jgi:hypothetical protein
MQTLLRIFHRENLVINNNIIKMIVIPLSLYTHIFMFRFFFLLLNLNCLFVLMLSEFLELHF